MQISITVQKLSALEPCDYRYYASKLKSVHGSLKNPDGTYRRFTVRDAFDVGIGLRDVLWCLSRLGGNEQLLRKFARQQALKVVHLWDCPSVVKEYLETGKEELRPAARYAADAAAWSAADAAARSAAEDAARSAARSAADAAADAAAWAAAEDAARDAASYAADAAAWSAARDAAEDAARSAARSAADAAADAAAWAAAWVAAWAAAEKDLVKLIEEGYTDD